MISALVIAFLYISILIFLIVFYPMVSSMAVPIHIKILLYVFTFLVTHSYLLWFCDLLGIKRMSKGILYLSYPMTYILIFTFFCLLVCCVIRIFYRFDIRQFGSSFLIVGAVLYLYGFINRYNIKITRHELDFQQSKQIKIVFISDIHIGENGMNAKIFAKAVEKINKENADVVILGGDIIEKDSYKFSEDGYAELMKKIKSRYGVYAVLGNHEYYREDPYKLTKIMENEGNIIVLNDRYVEFKEFYLIGREDITANRIGNGRKKLKDIMKSIPNTNKLKIVLDHNPKSFAETLENKANLQLSGHTHNGQFFPFNLIIKLFYEKPHGLLKKDNGYLATSSGLGVWGIPIKLGSRTEIMVVEIK
jgi:predicted MPP superfamily phosphohydrolase